MSRQVQKSRVKHLDDKLQLHPEDKDLITEREFVDEVCERHAKPGEAVYDASHDMELTGDQERMYKLFFTLSFRKARHWKQKG